MLTPGITYFCCTPFGIMKILDAEQIRAADAFTISSEGIPSDALMERSALAFVTEFKKEFQGRRTVHVFCGPGNNGGDGLAIARLLLGLDYKVSTFIVKSGSSFSKDFVLNHNRLLPIAPDHVFYLSAIAQFPKIAEETLLIDALFGSGLSRPLEGLVREVVEKINETGATVVAVDIPSGLYADKAQGKGDTLIKAKHTFSFQLPKLSFLLCHNHSFTGEWKLLDISLDASFIESSSTKYYYIDREYARSIIHPRNRCDHKGTFGHALIWAGSYGKIGAALLCSKAVLRSGAGLLTAYIPRCGYIPFQTALPEAMVLTDEEENHLTAYPALESYKSIGIGPGIERHKDTFKAFEKLLQETADKPLVIDADGLNMLSEKPVLLKLLSRNTILTPHPKEFERLAGPSTDDWERMHKATAFAQQHDCVLVLKSAYTSIHLPDGMVYFNATGNPGMAKGGSGDVLTGVITALLAQGYPAAEAATLGVYLHGLAGDIAVRKYGEWSLLAGELTDHIGAAWLELTNPQEQV
jgi:NAD(P)H-hydrate epimerase